MVTETGIILLDTDEHQEFDVSFGEGPKIVDGRYLPSGVDDDGEEEKTWPQGYISHQGKILKIHLRLNK